MPPSRWRLAEVPLNLDYDYWIDDPHFDLELYVREIALAPPTLGVSRVRPAWNLVVSNVPGPQFPLYMAGARLEAHYPISVVTGGMGLNVTVMS